MNIHDFFLWKYIKKYCSLSKPVNKNWLYTVIFVMQKTNKIHIWFENPQIFEEKYIKKYCSFSKSVCDTGQTQTLVILTLKYLWYKRQTKYIFHLNIKEFLIKIHLEVFQLFQTCTRYWTNTKISYTYTEIFVIQKTNKTHI